MSLSSSESIHRGYSIIRGVIDDQSGQQVNIGVIAWDEESNWFAIRILGEHERAIGVTAGHKNLADIAVKQLEKWSKKHVVPYSEGPLEPWTSKFWVAAGRVMTATIRLDVPRSMDPLVDRNEQLESLFEAVAKPILAPDRKAKRIDGAITSALGDAVRLFPKNLDLPAFHGTLETVLRGAVGMNGAVIIEGVNLASTSARRDADALVSRLLRIREGGSVNVLIGYVSSPGGLNGETDMRDWIRAKVTPNVFDVISESERFQAAAVQEFESIGPFEH